MKTLDIHSTIGRQELPWFAMFRINRSRTEFADWIRTAALVQSTPGLGIADLWAIEMDCGLMLGFQFLHRHDFGSVYASEPVSQHVTRHLSYWKGALVEQPAEVLGPNRCGIFDRMAREAPDAGELRAYQVWRQGDDGNQIAVGYATSRRDADCWVAELESHKHKQIYWSTRR